MKVTLSLALLLAVLAGPADALAQIEPQAPAPEFAPRSGGKAFLLSLAVPGLGHRYVNEGSWRGAATAFALADAAAWLGFASAEWREHQAIESFRTLARAEAGAVLDGKDRRFFINLASYPSSDAFREDQLRRRNWSEVGYVSDPAFQWAWSSTEAFQAYRDLRQEADAWNNRRTLFLSTLVANRLVAGLTALRAAGRHNRRAPDVAVAFTLPPPNAHTPTLNLSLRF